jgi:glycogen debranching enzyme
MDALCSNIGHLLWCNVPVPPKHRDTSAHQLLDEHLNSGWGVRTMSSLDVGFDAAGYHTGSVWPHDTSIAIAGLAAAGFQDHADQLARQLIAAAGPDGGRLPEVMAGTSRQADRLHPDPYPTTCSPQAWAAGAAILAVTTALGLQIDMDSGQLSCRTKPAPSWLHGLAITGLHAGGRRWLAQVDNAGLVTVKRLT